MHLSGVSQEGLRMRWLALIACLLILTAAEAQEEEG